MPRRDAFQALRLKRRTFIPVDAQPSQAVENALDEFRTIAFDVRVFNAQDHGAAAAAREKPVEKRGARAAHVQIAGRRWREPHANFACRFPDALEVVDMFLRVSPRGKKHFILAEPSQEGEQAESRRQRLGASTRKCPFRPERRRTKWPLQNLARLAHSGFVAAARVRRAGVRATKVQTRSQLRPGGL